MNPRLLVTAMAAVAAAPGTAAACGACVDNIVDVHLPFVKPLFVVMLLWSAVRAFVEKGFFWRLVASVGCYFALALLMLGSGLGPAVLFLAHWVTEVRFRVRHPEAKAPAWWRQANRLTGFVMVGLVSYGYAVTYRDPERLARLACYRGGASMKAGELLVAEGRRALPALMDEFFEGANSQRQGMPHRGVVLLARITGLDFGNSPERALAWWRLESRRTDDGEPWVPTPVPTLPEDGD